MSAFVFTLGLALLQSVSAQGRYTNATSLNILATAYGNDSLAFWKASQEPTFTKKLSFPGIKLNDTITSSGSIATSASSQIWQLQLNLSTVAVESSTNQVANLVYALEFPSDQLPLNDSDWQICGTIYDILADSVSGHVETPGNGSCAPYFTEACVNDYVDAALRDSTTDASGCASPPSLLNIPSCADRFRAANPGAITARKEPYLLSSFKIADNAGPGISTTAGAGLVYNHDARTYTNFVTGETNITNLVAGELRPDQSIGSSQYVFKNGTNITQEVGTLAKALRMVMLRAEPSQEFYGMNRTTGFAYQGGVRLICGRVDSTGDGDKGAATSLRLSLATTLATALVALLVMLW